MDVEYLIERLCAVNGMTGYEDLASSRIKEFFAPLCNEAWVDPFFNVIGLKKGISSKPKTIMITAHYDQIGLVVAGYEKNGFLRVSNLGGIDTKALLAAEVTVHGKEDLFGVIGAKPPHLLDGKELQKNMKITELFVDTGLSDERLKDIISIGDPVSLRSDVFQLKNGCMAGRSLDNRCGIAALVLILQQLQNIKHQNDIYVVATVQEETHLLGAVTSSYAIEPDVAVVIDACHGDMPDCDKTQTFTLGKGVPVAVGPAFHRAQTQLLLEAAKKERIPTQISVESGDPGTEAWAIQVSRLGIPTIEVSIPVRYMHTGNELVFVKDIEWAATLAAKYACGAFDNEFGGTGGEAV